jgi:hypothetical protein
LLLHQETRLESLSCSTSFRQRCLLSRSSVASLSPIQLGRGLLFWGRYLPKFESPLKRHQRAQPNLIKMPPKRRRASSAKNEQCGSCGLWFSSVAHHWARPENRECYRYQLSRRTTTVVPLENLDETNQQDDYDSMDKDWMDIDNGWRFQRHFSPRPLSPTSKPLQQSRTLPTSRIVEVHPTAGAVYGRGPNARISQLRSEKDPSNPHFPFDRAVEWQMASFLARSGLPQKKIDEFLDTLYIRISFNWVIFVQS